MAKDGAEIVKDCRKDIHRSIRGSAPHAPYNRHEYADDRCVWCGKYK